MTAFQVRLWAKIDVRGHDECWPWTAARLRNNKTGKLTYGVIGKPGGRGAGTMIAHVAVYLDAVGPVPEGWQVDHQCLNVACCNPRHLEAVTQAENLRRQALTKTHCRHGHEYNPTNTNLDALGHRVCLPCKRDRRSRRKLAEAS